MSFNLERLCYVIAGSAWIFWLGALMTHGWHQRVLLLGILAGLLIYSGIGSAMEGVAPEFVVFYLAFAVAVVAGFALGRVFFLPISRSMGRCLPAALPDVDRRRLWTWVIVTYVLLSAFPLVWPDFRLHELLTPSAPDLTTMFFTRFFDEPNAPTRIVNYMRLLITPFFFVALYRYRFRLRWVAALFCLLLYLQYVGNFCYIGRGPVMYDLLILLLAGWMLYPKARAKLALLSLGCIPVFFVACYAYAMVRIGGSARDLSLSKSMDAVLGVELGFVKQAGMVVYERGAHVNLADFVTWIFTLPIPKVLTGPIEGARINYEISELVLGRRTGSPGWYVILSGLVVESVYIYGNYWFWIHGLLMGGMAAFFARLMERVPQFFFLFLYVVLLFSYNLNRAGVGSLLPITTNEFLLFYLCVFSVVSGFAAMCRSVTVAVPIDREGPPGRFIACTDDAVPGSFPRERASGRTITDPLA